MSLLNITNSFSSVLSSNTKVLALERTLQQGLQDFKELLTDFEQLHIESDSYKTQYIKQKERCDSNSCSSAEALKRIIESKDNIIQLVASTLTRLNETKDLKILDEVFKILFGETTTVPMYQDNINCKEVKKLSPVNVKNEIHSSCEDLSFREESVSEIEGTPTGRVSPIIQMKKLKSSLVTSSDFRDKKKCPDIWPTPEKKTLKLSFSTPLRAKPNGKLRQARLNIVKVKESNFIDMTCTPEFSGGSRRNDSDGNVAPLIKKESIENDDTILPSPTSGPNNFTLFKSKESPLKFKKPQLSLKIKTEKKTPKKADQTTDIVIKQEQNTENILINDFKMHDSVTFTQDDSINLLNPNRIPKNFINQSPTKLEHNDLTYCETQASMSLLQHVGKLDHIHRDDNECSPSKRPLAENINVTNMQDDELQPSMSILDREPKVSRVNADTVKRKIPEFAEMIYKEPNMRKKSEKRMLPGWSCDKCKDFFGELYKDDPEMLAKKINECSHHRGVNNPTDRPKTPPGFWNPRWEVPDDTEEFNRMNNVD
uniref:DNA endonuclease activator Ctp1 C-terminal domain-containing protein n=1 Tax=Heliothis virescens TaxID=7102 RepID=A0A2A4J4I1_HELVI